MNLCTWNIRGLNDPLKVKEVKHLTYVHNIRVIALIETRVKPHNYSKVVKKHWQLLVVV